MRRLLAMMAMALLLPLLLTACMGDDDGSEASGDVSPDEVLQGASERWAETQSAHFELTVDGEAFLDDARTIKLQSAEGDVKRPDSVTATAKIDVDPLVVDVNLIAVGGQVYMTNFISGDWEKAPEDFSYDPSILFSDSEGIGPILTQLQSPALDGEEEVGGRQAHVVTGTVDAATVEDVTAGAILGESIDVRLWVDQETSDILRVSLTEPEGVSDSPATWNLELRDHDEDVTIEAPAV